jgi:hypothetical protein
MAVLNAKGNCELKVVPDIYLESVMYVSYVSSRMNHVFVRIENNNLLCAAACLYHLGTASTRVRICVRIAVRFRARFVQKQNREPKANSFSVSHCHGSFTHFSKKKSKINLLDTFGSKSYGDSYGKSHV